MIVYFDIMSGKEIGSDATRYTEPVKGIRSVEAKKITIADGEVNIGANASTEAEEDESFDASEAKVVINVVHASNLQKMALEKKEIKPLLGAYFKKILSTLNDLKFKSIGMPEDYSPPKDKAEAAAEEQAAVAKLDKYDRVEYDNYVARIATYKANFDAINKFVVEEIIKNFDECEFYTCEEGTLGSCMLIPARYIGEATAPTFYYFTDGMREQKV